MATAKPKFQRPVFNPANQNLINFLDELQKLAKNAFGVAAQVMAEQLLYTKLPALLIKLINHAHLEKETFDQIVSHLRKD